VEGTVARAGNHVRITAQLVRANDRHLWASTYEGELGDVLLLQRQIATQVAERVESRLRPGHTPLFRPVAVVNPVAYDEYLRGRYFWNKFIDFPQAIDHFARSVAADPGYAPAYVGLADCYQMLGTYLIKAPREVMPKAKEAALRAVALDETSGEAHVTLAHIMLAYDWDWSGWKREFERELTLSPNYALVHHWYANWLLVLGYPEEAIREHRRAVELDPLSLIINTNLCRAYLFARRYDEAIAQCRKTLELEPRFGPASVWLTSAYAAKGMYRAFIEEQQRMLRLQGTPEATREADEVGRMFAEQGFAKYDRWSSGEPGFVSTCSVSAGMLAEMYRSLGDRGRRWICSKACEIRVLSAAAEVDGFWIVSQLRAAIRLAPHESPPSTASTAQKR
jgi:tetratricopeptide (TPR) repeat protein